MKRLPNDVCRCSPLYSACPEERREQCLRFMSPGGGSLTLISDLSPKTPTEKCNHFIPVEDDELP